MPYKWVYDKKKIPRELNRNVKLSLDDRDKIRDEYKFLKSQRKLALKWGVSRRLINFILNPEKEQHNKELQKLRNHYDKEKNTNYMRKYRKNKQKLALNGKLL